MDNYKSGSGIASRVVEKTENASGQHIGPTIAFEKEYGVPGYKTVG